MYLQNFYLVRTIHVYIIMYTINENKNYIILSTYIYTYLCILGFLYLLFEYFLDILRFYIITYVSVMLLCISSNDI